MSNNRSGRFLGGVVLGAAAGAIAGLLVAPRPGQETRRQLKKTAQRSANALPELAEDLTNTIKFQADRLSDHARQSWDDTLLRLKDAIAAGVEAGMEASQQSGLKSTSKLMGRSTSSSDNQDSPSKVSTYFVDDD